MPAIFRRLAQATLEAFGLRPGERLLDAACGTGIVGWEVLARQNSAGSETRFGLTSGMIDVTRQPLLAGFQELRRPIAVEALCDPFAPALVCDRVRGAQVFQDDAEPLLRGVLLARCAADLADMGFGLGLRP